MIKYSLWALLFWLFIAMLAAGAEYMWIGDTEASAIKNLWRGWGLIGTIIGTAGIIMTFIAGSRGSRIVTLGATAVVIWALKDIMTFNYPTIFYGYYEIARWVILLIMIAIFIMPIMMSLISRGTSAE